MSSTLSFFRNPVECFWTANSIRHRAFPPNATAPEPFLFLPRSFPFDDVSTNKWPVFLAVPFFAIVVLLFRLLFKRVIGPIVCSLCGVKSALRRGKFSYNLWLVTYYLCASVSDWKIYASDWGGMAGCPFSLTACAPMIDPWPEQSQILSEFSARSFIGHIPSKSLSHPWQLATTLSAVGVKTISAKPFDAVSNPLGIGFAPPPCYMHIASTDKHTHPSIAGGIPPTQMHYSQVQGHAGVHVVKNFFDRYMPFMSQALSPVLDPFLPGQVVAKVAGSVPRVFAEQVQLVTAMTHDFWCARAGEQFVPLPSVNSTALLTKYIDAYDAGWHPTPQAPTFWGERDGLGPIPTSVAMLYVVQVAFYISEIISLFLEPRRSDFAMYLAHHFFTIALLVLSWVFGEVRCGLVVVLLHDPPDVLISLAKMFVYTNRKLFAHFFFGLFAVSFFVLRLVGLPLLVSMFFVFGCHGRGVAATGVACWGPSELILAILLLTLLMPLHIHWFRIIWQIAVRQSADDPRSDDDEGEKPPKRSASPSVVKGPTQRQTGTRRRSPASRS